MVMPLATVAAVPTMFILDRMMARVTVHSIGMTVQRFLLQPFCCLVLLLLCLLLLIMSVMVVLVVVVHGFKLCVAVT